MRVGKCFNVVIIGAGYMSQQYTEALNSLALSFRVSGVVGRKKHGPAWVRKTGVSYFNSLEAAMSSASPSLVIVCVSENSTLDVLKTLVGFTGCVLVEKPVGRNIAEFDEIQEIVDQHGLNLRVALNRRFFKGVQKLREIFRYAENQSFIIQDQQGPSDFSAERLTAIGSENILFANSIHLIDTLCFISGARVFASSPQVLVGESGVYSTNFTLDEEISVRYHMAWETPGPWRICLYSEQYYGELSPLESIIVRDKKRSVLYDFSEDTDCKPGLVPMLNEAHSWVSNESCAPDLPTLKQARLPMLLISSLFKVGVTS